MGIERAKIFRPVAEPRVIEGAYSEDQHSRLLDLVRRNGPYTLIISQHFKSAEEYCHHLGFAAGRCEAQPGHVSHARISRLLFLRGSLQ